MPYDSVDQLPANIKKLPDKKARQWMHVWNSAYSACTSRDDATSSKDCEGEAFRKANGVIRGSEVPEALHSYSGEMGMGAGMKLEKVDKRVEYQAQEAGATERCGNCRFFCSIHSDCNLVEGSIDPAWICNLWSEQMSNQPSMVGMSWSEPLFQVFIEAPAQAFADDKSNWIPFLPKPGPYEHPEYGKIEVTPNLNQELIDSFKNGVYQEHIPLDAEHQTKVSGAVAWLKDMRLNEDGSADALVDWTPRGRQLIEDGGFKYVSPEWFDTWRDPASGEVHTNVVAGGAITTRPFFKDKVLRALVASERGIEVIGEKKEPARSVQEGGNRTVPGSEDPKTLTMTEVEARIKTVREETEKSFTEKISGLETQLEAAKTVAATEKESRENLAKVVELQQAKERTRRFTDEIAGKGGSNDGSPWVGDAEKHLSLLNGLAEKFGEDSELVTAYIEQNRAVATQVKEAEKIGNLTGEVGQTGRAQGLQSATEPERKLDELAKAYQKDHPDKTYVQAYTEVVATPEGVRLYGETQALPRRGV